ncbi:FKBP-type peptidyl-prolyl cis-trans isomerase N-terminal domain-containing protein [Vulcaniibacterium gelatinicum]|uniref:FKBP-type peptidyl-prolyl cis-trans isomerase N-terminal domain-containing protein n=1 Tax=Vulcaniibacterium gelatinicum TaxID=2598725 RepID=UPI0011CBE092|nr:FKBP-type peptidyl-prolyl cis-trans isomerase [Vulcaniibacterium gelatinicum]
MKALMRGVAALLTLAALAAVSLAVAQDKTTLATEREKVGYMIGLDVGRSISPVGPDLDMAAFERAIVNAFAGGKPLLDEAESRNVAQALMQRIAARSGRAQPGQPVPEVAKDKVGLLVGTDVGRSLAPIKAEFDLPLFLQGVRTVLAGGKPLLSDEEANALRQSFSRRLQEKMQAEAAALAQKNKQEGAAFLAKNKTVKGVYTTPSGLQYMVLRQGAGPRPKPTDVVRVNYHGTRLDGTVFDSSYERGQPAEFALNQVIPGWTEGVGLMPVGSKYRFWIPAELAYGENGPPGIGPNATLVFDVELLDIRK